MFGEPERPVPTGLDRDRFVLEPLTPAHLERDYQAVMATRPLLRRWSGTSWPADDFTLAGNLADLEMHDGEHRRREAFTYTMLTPDRETCLGCVYLTPLGRLSEANPGLVAGPRDAVVGFWVTEPAGAEGLDAELVTELRRWLSDEWDLGEIRFSARTELTEQVALLRASGLAERHRVTVPGRSGDFLLFG